jgi:hypothetical protein
MQFRFDPLPDVMCHKRSLNWITGFSLWIISAVTGGLKDDGKIQRVRFFADLGFQTFFNR